MRTQQEIDEVLSICGGCKHHSLSKYIGSQCGRLACGINRRGLKTYFADERNGCPIGLSTPKMKRVLTPSKTILTADLIPWLNEFGQVIVDETGAPILCETCPCVVEEFTCADYLVGFATNGVDAAGEITVDFSSISIQPGDLICQHLANQRTGATFLPLPSGWSFVTQVTLTNLFGTLLNLHHSFKVADGSETSVTRTLTSGTAHMASVVTVWRHPTGSFPVASGIFDGTYGNGWYFKNYSSVNLTDPFAIHNNGNFLVQTVGEADMLHVFGWASIGGVDLFAGQGWLTTDPEFVAYATSPNSAAQVGVGHRCIPYPGEVINSSLFMWNPINEDTWSLATYAGYQTAPPPP